MSFKLNLKPATAFANGESEQNEIDAATRNAEAEERAHSNDRDNKSTSPTHNTTAISRLSISPRGDGTVQTHRHSDPYVNQGSGTQRGAAPPPMAALRLGRVEGITEITSETDSAPTTNRDTTRTAPPPAFSMVPGLRLGTHNRQSSNLSDVAAADSSRTREEQGALQRKGTSVPANPTTSTPSTSAPPIQVMSSIPAFSIALSKLNHNSAHNTNTVGGSGNGPFAAEESPRSGRFHSQHSSFHQPQNYQLNRFNPEIEKPVDIDEEDDFLAAVDDLPQDTKALKTQLLEARKEILGWETRFDLMRDHYQNHVAKLITHLEHEHAVHHQELAATHGVSYHGRGHNDGNLDGTINTLSGTTTSTNNSPPGSGPGRSRNPPFVINTVTARGTNGTGRDMAIQTDITVALLDVMIKYPQSIRGERGLTRASSPAVTNAKRAGSPTTTGHKKSTTKSTSVTAGRHSASPAPTTSRATSLAAVNTTARKEKTPSDRKSTGSDSRPQSQGTGTPMSRSLLGPSATRSLTNGRSGPLAGSLSNGSGLLGSKVGTTPQTSRARNSAVLSVNSYGSKPLTPRASLATSRGVSPAPNNGSITSRASGVITSRNITSVPPGPGASSQVSIPLSLSSAYVKPGARKFNGLLSGGTTPTKGGPMGASFEMSGSRRDTDFAGSASFGNGISSSGVQSPMRSAPPPPNSASALHSSAASPVKAIISRPQMTSSGSRYPAVSEHLTK